MNDKYIVDLRHLVDLNKTKVYIEVSSCLEYEYPTEGMNWLYHLLSYVQNHINEFQFKEIKASVFNNLLKKIEENKNYLYELDNYIEFANENFKKDKGWTQDNATSIGLPKASFKITIEELIEFYKSLEQLERYYDMLKEKISIGWTCNKYFKNIENIKNMLEKRLAFAMIKVVNRKFCT
ncbi:hypothetical protein [Clostridium botulinum]|uniref:hypothetical protein n=1 Tax=Clostridium botulinum TaxID=1491 RepID=UPI0006AC33FD|nr:hypothetical protein [Clostridium botulinum]AUM88272.1 hypothetical protein RSJ15_11390 [Clostridium botulinum]KOR54873.1 hypothetical protein ADT23_00330 [Clostridium botulinum]MBD5587621.1 hypothetical protein [Clostridium botulinum]MBY6839599.1 hypothetical protein [Clostridium botulinum]MCR1163744.1 hypothetical protein [Clostridium botulinum]